MSPPGIWPLYMAVLVVTPLALGGNRPLAIGLVGAAVALLTLLQVRNVQRGSAAETWGISMRLPALLVTGLLIWLVLQSSEAFAAFTDLGHPIWRAARETGLDVGDRVSAAPDNAWIGVMKLLTTGAIFWLALQLGGDHRRAVASLKILAIASAVYALYGIMNLALGNSHLLWFPRWAYPGDATGPFVNRNTFATFVGLGLIISVALGVRAYRRAMQLSDRSEGAAVRRATALSGSAGGYFLLATLNATALLQSHSRMGMLSGAAGLVALLLLYVVRRQGARNLAMAFLGLAALATFSVFGPDMAAMLGSADGGHRGGLFAITLAAIADAPLTGHGYGAFAQVFPIYRDFGVPPEFDYSAAHNTYLELAFDLGIPAALLITLVVAGLAARCSIAAVRVHHSRICGAVAAAASVTVALHATMDFSLQIPAVSNLYFALLGLGVAGTLASRSSTARAASIARDGAQNA